MAHIPWRKAAEAFLSSNVNTPTKAIRKVPLMAHSPMSQSKLSVSVAIDMS